MKKQPLLSEDDIECTFRPKLSRGSSAKSQQRANLEGFLRRMSALESTKQRTLDKKRAEKEYGEQVNKKVCMSADQSNRMMRLSRERKSASPAAYRINIRIPGKRKRALF